MKLRSNVIVQGITIIAPITSPNTDGINPGSSLNCMIVDSYNDDQYKFCLNFNKLQTLAQILELKTVILSLEMTV